MQRGPTSGSSWREKQVRKGDKERFEGLKDRDWGRLGVRGEIKGRRVAQSECYCLRLNVSKAKMMMPGEAGGCGGAWPGLAIWRFPQPGVPTPRCQHEKE